MKTNEEFIQELNNIIDGLEDRHYIKRIKNINQSFYADLDFDSLSFVEMIFDCEHTYKIKIKDDELIGITTVEEVINLLKKHIKNNEKTKD